jgi:methyl-accepting chemotaxis protein
VSSIGEAKERLAAAAEDADEAVKAVDSALKSVGNAVKSINEAAADSGHERVQDSLGAYQEATEKLTEALAAIVAGREAGDDYAVHIG